MEREIGSKLGKKVRERNGLRISNKFDSGLERELRKKSKWTESRNITNNCQLEWVWGLEVWNEIFSKLIKDGLSRKRWQTEMD